MTKERLLIIFVKNPVLGKVKTRLAKTVGAEKALFIYKALLTHTKEISLSVEAAKAVFYSDLIDEQDLWCASIFEKYKQEGNDLGERMYHAFELGFSKGYQHIVIIGSDCLDLSSNLIDEAFENLANHDFVIGPAKDGGYYLLGMKKLCKDVFEHKNWSTSTVLQETMKDLEALNATCYYLPVLSDIDEENDLRGKL